MMFTPKQLLSFMVVACLAISAACSAGAPNSVFTEVDSALSTSPQSSRDYAAAPEIAYEAEMMAEEPAYDDAAAFAPAAPPGNLSFSEVDSAFAPAPPADEPSRTNQEGLAAMQFQDYGVNPFVSTTNDHLSTFAIDVDTGSYTLMRRYISDGMLPPIEAVRVEEFVNYFDQQYPIPANEAFSIHLEAAPAPYSNEGHHLLRVGIQGYDVPVEERPDALLIFVVDVSGSMERANRLGLVKQALVELVNNLKPTDQIGIVTYGSRADVILEPTYVVAKEQITRAIARLNINGSTNVEEGLMVAYGLANEYAREGNINRLIVASDGVANVGNVTAETILQHARDGIQLSTFGFGMGNYNDVLMEQLANQGDGTYAYIDTMDEARRIFEDQLLATILTIAKDAKIQVDFNPNVVQEYRLLGYENRDVADEDFRNDAVDAGEIGAGHSVTALYEVLFAEEANPNEAALTVQVRYQDPDTAEVIEIAQSMAGRDVHSQWGDASPTFQLSAVVAEYAEILRQSYWAQDGNMAQVTADVRQVARLMPQDVEVQEFVGLVAQATAMHGR